MSRLTVEFASISLIVDCIFFSMYPTQLWYGVYWWRMEWVSGHGWGFPAEVFLEDSSSRIISRSYLDLLMYGRILSSLSKLVKLEITNTYRSRRRTKADENSSAFGENETWNDGPLVHPSILAPSKWQEGSSSCAESSFKWSLTTQSGSTGSGGFCSSKVITSWGSCELDGRSSLSSVTDDVLDWLSTNKS